MGLVSLRALAIATSLLVLAAAAPARAGDTEVVAPTASVTLELLPDAWPALPRVIGYEYNQKNHHDAPSFEGGGADAPALDAGSKRKRWRVVGLAVRNPDAAAAFEGKIAIRSQSIEPRRVKVGPRAEAVAYFAIVDDMKKPFKAELLNAKEQVVATLECPLAPPVRPTVNRYDALFVAQELNNEDRVRQGYPSFPVSVRVLAEGDRPLSHARLTFHHEQFGMIETAEADEHGAWSGRLLGGAWTAIAFGQAVEEGGANETTIVRTPRTLYLLKQFEATGAGVVSVDLKADQMAKVRVRDESGAPLEVLRLTVAPHRIAEALRFADVASRCADAFILDVDMRTQGGAIDLLTNKNASYDLMAVARPADGTTALLTVIGTQGDGEIPMTFAPARMSRLVFDAPTGFGGGRSIEATVTLLGAQRQSYAFAAEGLESVYFPPGAGGAAGGAGGAGPSGGVAGAAAGGVRVDMTYTLRNGDRLTFVPRRIEGKPGAIYDATPRPPFAMSLFYKQQRGVQIWVGLTDGAGQVVDAIQSQGQVTAWRGEQKLFEQALDAMSFGFPAGLDKVKLEEVALETKVRVGTEWLRGRPAIEPVKKIAAHGTWANAPRVVEDHVDSFLAMVAKSCESEKRVLGGPPAPVGMDFQVFLPPGVGGLGGGGMIALGLNDLLRFTHETDPLPYAYCHELGHNVGFGHDPYMLLAPCGVEEGTYGALGYRMANGKELEAVFRFLEGRRCQDQGTWTLSPHLFAGIRLLFGAEIHRKMFEAQHAYEAGLKAAGLSSIERIATLYSLALGENVAWIFRAYGWPVFDARVQWGRSVALTSAGAREVQPVSPEAMQMAAFRRWWVQGPLELAKEGEEPAWQTVTWPTDFVALDQDRGAASDTRSYRLFDRISVPSAVIADLVACSDVAIEVRVNGHAVARLDASPQQSQPVHDELMLDKKKAFPVLLLAGENTIEVDASQPPGARGFILGLCGPDGRPIQVSMKKEGPESDAEPAEPKTVKPVGPVLNGGFEEGAGAGLAAWINGPIEGGLKPAADDAAPASGKRCLRIDVASSGAGGVIQRVVVEPGASYRVRAKIRAERLDGEAYVSLFTGDINAPITKTDVLKPAPGRWTEIDGRFAAQKRRCVYVCCYVKAKDGTVWFDDVELIREK
jgi:hypothetical protein